MKLNPDCVRDCLLWLEDNLKINENNSFAVLRLNDLYGGLPEYDQVDIYYTIYNLFQIRYIEGKFSFLPSGTPKLCEIYNITWSGHQFLNNIRPKSVWDATKTNAKKLGIMSMNALSFISSKVTESLIDNPALIAKIVEQVQQL